MASVNGGANLRNNSTRQRRNPIVPAIPLPYMQRRAQNQAAAKAAVAAAATTPQSPPVELNGDAQATPKGVVVEPARSDTSGPSSRNGLPPSGGVSLINDADALPSERVSPSQTSEVTSSASSTCESVRIERPAQTDEPDAGSIRSPVEREVNGRSSSDGQPTGSQNGRDGYGAPAERVLSPANMYSQEHVPRNHMPPPFHPSGMFHGGDVPPGAHPAMMMNPRPTHQPHPSAGSIHFGAFHDSANSSPAPLAGGYPPPPGLPLPNGRPSFMGRPSGPEFRPQSMMYAGEFEPTSGIDPYGQSMAAYAHAHHDGGYPPYMGNYFPSTPHSFHGSQSPAHADDSGAYRHFNPHFGTNGSPVYIDDGRGRGPGSVPMGGMPPPPPPQMIPPPPPPNPSSQGTESDADHFFSHLKNHFQDPRFADCTLELRFNDNRSLPLMVPAHRLVLAQSERLDQLMEKEASASRHKNIGNSTVVVNAEDSYIRPDSFLTALQCLYGFPLFSTPAPAPGSEDLPLAGNVLDRFSFAVSYAAAGNLLKCRSVVVRGMELAAQLMSWDTLEPALEFALGACQARGTVDIHGEWPYGEATKILLDAVVRFIVSHLSPDFSLDTSIPDPRTYRRVPEVPQSPMRPANPKNVLTTMKRGIPPAMSDGQRSRLTKIKFGDMAAENAKASDNAKATEDTEENNRGAIPTHTSRRVPPHFSALSRALLNMPFGCLKAILESPAFGMGVEMAEVRSDMRQRLAAEVVSERESRRLAAVEAVKGGWVPNAAAIRRILSYVEPKTTDAWSVLGFQEAVMPLSNAPVPFVSRAWVPLSPSDDEGRNDGFDSSPAYP